MYSYYLIYEDKHGKGNDFITRDTPLNSEAAIIEEHKRLEKKLGRPVVIVDWKRID